MEVTEEGRGQVEQQLEQLLAGQGSEVSGCDVGLDQSKPATLRKNVTYIVCGVIFNDKEEVLMVQEAKQDCYKLWYLPAGRVEVGESLEEALRREVKEEAGFDCEPITLLLIQEQGPQWIRFIFLARVTGQRWNHQECVRSRPGVSAGVLVGQEVRPPAARTGHPAPHRLRPQVPSGRLAPADAAAGAELPPRAAETGPGLHRGRPAGLDPAAPSPRGAPPPDSSGGEDPRRDLGGEHGGAGGHAVGVPRPRRQHAGRLQPAARRPAAREDGRRVLQHAGGAGARPRPTQRGRREGGVRAGRATSAGREPSVRVVGDQEPSAEREAAGEDQEHLHPPAAQPVLTTRGRQVCPGSQQDSYCETTLLLAFRKLLF